MVKIYCCSIEDKKWSQSPISTYINVLNESITIQEWISRSKNYIAHRPTRYGCLVKYKGTEGKEIVGLWIGWLEDNGNNSAIFPDKNDVTAHKLLKQFGLVPFSRKFM